ncbi:MAG: phospholipase D family protein [Gammaproteobacteria bacterium]
MRVYIRFLMCSIVLLYVSTALAYWPLLVNPNATNKFSPDATYQVCFTPDQNCTRLLVNAIHQAKSTIQVQAFSFTSAPIARALIEAHKRGIKVQVILDKSQFQGERYSSSKFLSRAGIPVYIDYQPNLAHNKVIILDGAIVVTGSFNFTKAAEKYNAENLLIIQDKKLAQAYVKNWQQRLTVSKSLENYHGQPCTHCPQKKIVKNRNSLTPLRGRKQED